MDNQLGLHESQGGARPCGLALGGPLSRGLAGGRVTDLSLLQPTQNPAPQPRGGPHIDVVGVDIVGVWVSIQHQQSHSRMVVCRQSRKQGGEWSEGFGQGASPACFRATIYLSAHTRHHASDTHSPGTPGITLSYHPHLWMRKLRLREITLPYKGPVYAPLFSHLPFWFWFCHYLLGRVTCLFKSYRFCH